MAVAGTMPINVVENIDLPTAFQWFGANITVALDDLRVRKTKMAADSSLYYTFSSQQLSTPGNRPDIPGVSF